MKRAIYPGSFDPITNAHKSMIELAATIFDELIVGVGVNPDKKYTFTMDERVDMARKSLAQLNNVKVAGFRGMLVDYAYENGIQFIIRGLRNAQDFNTELNLHFINWGQNTEIKTIFIPTRIDMTHISSSATKAIQKETGMIHDYVSPFVKKCLEARMSAQYLIGITGPIASGKTYIGKKLCQIGQQHGIAVHNIDFDEMSQQILSSLDQQLYNDIRLKIADTFGNHVLLKDGKVNRKALGEIVFQSKKKLKKLNEIMYKPLLIRLRRELYNKNGIILINAALLAEFEMLNWCNNNMILVDVARDAQINRLQQRDLTKNQLSRRIESQYSSKVKKEKIEHTIQKEGRGRLFELDNTNNASDKKIEQLFQNIRFHLDIYGELRYQSLWHCLSLGDDYSPSYIDLVNTYSQKHRYYHNLNHILFGLKELDKVQEQTENYPILSMSWWYHDVIYDVHKRNNEEMSAAKLTAILRSNHFSEKLIQQVKNLILTTQLDQEPQTIDEKIISDIDLAIFGQKPDVFKQYEDNIRKEYSHVLEEKYKKARAKILQQFLDRDNIYYSSYFRQQYEKQAQENLLKSLEHLHQTAEPPQHI